MHIHLFTAAVCAVSVEAPCFHRPHIDQVAALSDVYQGFTGQETRL